MDAIDVLQWEKKGMQHVTVENKSFLVILTYRADDH